MNVPQHQLEVRNNALLNFGWLNTQRFDDYCIPSGEEMAYLREQEAILLQEDNFSWEETEERMIRYPFTSWAIEKQYIYGLKYAWDCCGNCFPWKEAFQLI